MATYENPGQVNIANGTIPVATVMGISNENWVVNGTASNFATAVAKFTYKKLIENSYDNSWNKALRIQEMGNEGTVMYTFLPAVLPVSNWSQSDIGNRSFGTKMNVYGRNILFLQVNFWTNEFVSVTDKDYISSVQKQLIGTYSKSISIMKNELSIIENALFCLATGQFLFTDELGKKILDDPNDPNNLALGQANMLWSTQSPRLTGATTTAGILPNAFLRQELNAFSTWLMMWPLTINTFNIGYSLNQLAVVCSFYMRSNLAFALNAGWPTETQMNMVNNSSYIKPALSQWYNLVLTDTNTVPYLQNDVGLVSPEISGGINEPSNNYSAQPLGYGINNICDMGYTRNIVAMTTFEGAIDQYYTTTIPFNPYNIPSSKTWYRIGYMWGWGQVHVPNYWGTSWMFLDPSAYVTVFQTFSTATTNPDCDWTQNISYTVGTTTYNFTQPTNLSVTGFTGSNETYAWSNPGNGNPMAITSGATTITPMCNFEDGDGNPYFIYNKVLNGMQYTILVGYNVSQLLTDMTQAQATLELWEPGMGYKTYCFPALPSDTNDNMLINVSKPYLSGTVQLGNSCNLTFAQWAGLRSLRALNMPINVTNEQSTTYITVNNQNVAPFQLVPNGTYKVMELFKPGYNQLYMQPYQYAWNMPNDVPYLTNPGYSQSSSSNNTNSTMGSN